MAILSNEKVRNAIKGSCGVRSRIARACGVSPSALTQWLATRSDIDEEIKAERDVVVDFAEDRLLEIAKFGSIKDATTLNAVLKILNNLGRERGWSDKIDINSKNVNLDLDFDSAKRMNEIYYNLIAERREEAVSKREDVDDKDKEFRDYNSENNIHLERVNPVIRVATINDKEKVKQNTTQDKTQDSDEDLTDEELEEEIYGQEEN